MTPEVIDAINEELSYIATLNDQERSDDTHHGTEGQLLTLKVYCDKAIAAWVSNPGDDEALEQLRKCAAIAVRALITERCPRRVIYHAVNEDGGLDLNVLWSKAKSRAEKEVQRLFGPCRKAERLRDVRLLTWEYYFRYTDSAKRARGHTG